MLNFLGKRVLQLIPTLFFVSVLIFSLQHLLPGDPALVMAGEERDPAVIASDQLKKIPVADYKTLKAGENYWPDLKANFFAPNQFLPCGVVFTAPEIMSQSEKNTTQ